MQKEKRRIKSSIRLDRIVILAGLFFISITFLVIMINNLIQQKEIKITEECHTKSKINLLVGSVENRQGTVHQNKPICFYFEVSSDVNVMLFSESQIAFITPSNHKRTLQGSSNLNFSAPGIYSIIINTSQKFEEYQVTLKLESKKITENSKSKINVKLPYNQETDRALQLIYNVVTPPPLKPNSRLQTIVDDIVKFVDSKGLPIDRLSVSLMDLNGDDCCAYAQYLDREPRFPASVTKLFWLVYLYAEYEVKLLPEGTVPYKKIAKMIQDSDNESASFIVDTITQTKSGESLPTDEINQWIQKRLAMNSFFEQAGYYPINISQKLFPTSYNKNDSPSGRDLQIRGEDRANPIRNYTTTYNVARLLFEIEQEKAISKKYSKNMKLLLTRSLRPSAWKNKEFNAIEGFLGEYLPEKAYFASKMGWNFNTRNDAAIIGSPDGKHKYILVIFGDHPSFYKDKKVFPEVSRLVYKSMTN